MKEPTITINNHLLTDAQASTVRVAIEALSVEIAGGLGMDRFGVEIALAYRTRIEELRRFMYFSEKG